MARNDDSRGDLDAQYDTSKQLADGNVSAYFDAFEAASVRARTGSHGERDIRYGPHERETFDFFPATRAGAPLLIWIHGGYWRRLSKDYFSFVAPPVVTAGGAVAILNYPLAPGPSLDEIVESVARGYAVALAHAAASGCDIARTVVGGHSVGAQLAGTIVARNAVVGMLAISGLYDLEPVRHTYVNEWIAMDAACARRNGPIHLKALASPRLVASVGGHEQAAFAEQQATYVAAWRAWGGEADVVDAPDRNHFDIVLELERADAPLTRALLGLLGLH